MQWQSSPGWRGATVKRLGASPKFILTAVLLAAWAGSAAAHFPIAGTAPHARPEGAPQITNDARSPEWMQQALFGISEPFPNSLLFLFDQGNWYTPFNRPGMPGIYDLRGWHGPR